MSILNIVALKVYLLLLIQFQEARRVQICFYDSERQPIDLRYYWIDTNDTEKEYPMQMMQHAIDQHQEMVVWKKSVQIVFQRKNGDLGYFGLHVKQPGRFNVIINDGIYVKCKSDCVGFRKTVLPDVTVEAP
ncbi:hypothetical protein [Lacihabitans soyangensis]|uniref:Uncharacterized protein n=1 Tax=Lacihabitans soyangensis TaxID=869394 RepID=A0AAE3H7Q6_9BACT|nr:hypothetical protein [Lacihabitans soyangensis]MCP9765659.1 hypothetical protein [Lacihabitans soyangensis]